MARALVISQSAIQRDSRVRRQIDWLLESGWEVDTIGLGPAPDGRVDRHFEMRDAPAWTKPRPLKALVHLIPSFRARFRLLSVSRIPAAARAALAAGDYSFVLFEDIHLIPWVGEVKTFGPHRSSMRVHLDVHEFHPPTLAANVAGRRLVSPYYRWQRAYIGSPEFDSRSVVAEAYADVYTEEFAVPRPAIIRNAPPRVDQTPTPVDPTRIRLVYHGGAVWVRGLRQIVEALDHLDDRFTMTFMLTGSPRVREELEEACAKHDRVSFIPSVPVHDVARAVNDFDLEVMFYPPTTENLRLALPNKLFEAVQGRLGLVIGDSPSMRAIVERFGNGVVVDGWSGTDLARALNELSPDDVAAFKAASTGAAAELNAETERSTFLAIVGQAPRP